MRGRNVIISQVMKRALSMQMQFEWAISGATSSSEQTACSRTHYLLAFVQMTAASCRFVCNAVTRSSSCEEEARLNDSIYIKHLQTLEHFIQGIINHARKHPCDLILECLELL